MYLDVRGLTKTFGDFTALNDVSLGVEGHEFVCLLGPSGCGKTTLLRIIAGLTDSDQGTIYLQEEDLTGTPARRRGFGIVFQSYSLFPNMMVGENIGYGLKIRGVPRARITTRVTELLATIKLPDLADRYPWQLSGGQQQRVALARAIAVDPKLLLLDEPLSALDAKVRADLRVEIRDLQRSLGIPTLMVTHDQEEALTLADRVVCMNHGRVEQVGTPEDLYLRPRTRFVADFMGVSNLIETDRVRAHLPSLLEGRPDGADDAYIACVRPEQIAVTADTGGGATVQNLSFLGNLTRMTVTGPLGALTIEAHGQTNLTPGQAVRCDIAPGGYAWVRNMPADGI